ncbi:MAG TPA: RNA polymerase subunit sigma-70 [Planctomycetaceae bacterium]|nr:RNA polymerase subunit sigma-70 [Blastopirellula sp.]HAY79553.1 RNA polymerase subunit sigma-70 [Planctomycetaceae bacterium]
MPDSDRSEQFVQQLTESQNRIYGYVYSLVGDHGQTGDVVQETNLVLWRKLDEFDVSKPFLPWALAIARFQVLAHLRDRKRDRCLLDPELVELLADESERQAGQFDAMRDALRLCLQTLPDPKRQLIEQRYFRSRSLNEMAASTNRTVGALKVAVLRVRRQLAGCVERRMARGEA